MHHRVLVVVICENASSFCYSPVHTSQQAFAVSTSRSLYLEEPFGAMVLVPGAVVPCRVARVLVRRIDIEHASPFDIHDVIMVELGRPSSFHN